MAVFARLELSKLFKLSTRTSGRLSKPSCIRVFIHDSLAIIVKSPLQPDYEPALGMCYVEHFCPNFHVQKILHYLHTFMLIVIIKNLVLISIVVSNHAYQISFSIGIVSHIVS